MMLYQEQKRVFGIFERQAFNEIFFERGTIAQ